MKRVRYLHPPDEAETEAERIARGKRLRWARELVEPNRAKFARRLGVDVSSIRNIEYGKKNPSVGLLYRICHALRIDLAYVAAGRLTGVDRELRELLVQEHPRLARRWLFEQAAQQPAAPHRGRRRKSGRSKHDAATLRVV